MSYFFRPLAGAGLAIALLTLGLSEPARAEFFGCNGNSSHVVWRSAAVHGWRAYPRHSHYFAAPSRQFRRGRVVYADGRHHEPHRINW